MFEKRLNKTTKKFLVGFEGQGQESIEHEREKKLCFFTAFRAFLTVLEKTFSHRSLVDIPRMEWGVISPDG